MSPFEAACYADGWAARMTGQERTENPYTTPFASWDKYRRNQWDRGWFHCDHGAVWVDPRTPRRQRKGQAPS